MPHRLIHVVIALTPRGEHVIYSTHEDVLLVVPGDVEERERSLSVDDAFLAGHSVLDLELGRARRWLSLNGG